MEGIMERIDIKSTYIIMTHILSLRSTCKRAKVGALIASANLDQILSIGYNGNATKLLDSCDSDEKGNCGCIHAEENALIKCSRSSDDSIMFCNYSPCPRCAKLILNFGKIRSYYYSFEYRVPEGKNILKKGGVELIKIKVPIEEIIEGMREYAEE